MMPTVPPVDTKRHHYQGLCAAGAGSKNRGDATIESMNLTINGETQISSAETLSALVEGLGMKPDRVAIELNREIVPREQWPQTPLHDGDRLEIVHFVGGGSEYARLSPHAHSSTLR